jgi:hypothetical protein
VLEKKGHPKEGSPGRTGRIWIKKVDFGFQGGTKVWHASRTLATVFSRCTAAAQPAPNCVLSGSQDKGMNSRPRHPSGEMTHVLTNRVSWRQLWGPLLHSWAAGEAAAWVSVVLGLLADLGRDPSLLSPMPPPISLKKMLKGFCQWMTLFMKQAWWQFAELNGHLTVCLINPQWK